MNANTCRSLLLRAVHEESGLTFRYINLRFLFCFFCSQTGTANHHSTNVIFLLSPCWKHFTTFVLAPPAVEVSASVTADRLKMEERPSDQSQGSAWAGRNPPSRVELVRTFRTHHVSWRSHHASVSAETGSTSLSLSNAPRRRSSRDIYVHVLELISVVAWKINPQLFLLWLGGMGCGQDHRASGWPQKLSQKGPSPHLTLDIWLMLWYLMTSWGGGLHRNTLVIQHIFHTALFGFIQCVCLCVLGNATEYMYTSTCVMVREYIIFFFYLSGLNV